MASYQKPCVHCGSYIEPDSHYCPVCGSGSPFGYLCPACLRPVEKTLAVCSGCGRSLYVDCPHWRAHIRAGKMRAMRQFADDKVRKSPLRRTAVF